MHNHYQVESRSSIARAVPVAEAVGMVLGHDITEVRGDEFKGRAFKKGHVVRPEDIGHLKRLGKEHIYALEIAADELHEDDAALMLSRAILGEGAVSAGEPSEGRITVIAERDGLLSIKKEALLALNMSGELMCATLHNNSCVKKGQEIAGFRAIPLIVKKQIVELAAEAAEKAGGLISVKSLRSPKAGVVITGGEVYYGRVQDAFAPVIERKIVEWGGEVIGTYFAPDDAEMIVQRVRELIAAGADLLIVTGGMSVDPDDITRHAIRSMGASGLTYGSAVLPGSMFLIAYYESKVGLSAQRIPIVGIPACGMYFRTTVFDLVLPRLLAGEDMGRRELAELGHGGLCMNCKECLYPHCAFGK